MITPKGKADLVISIIIISCMLLIDSLMKHTYYITLIFGITLIIIDISYDIFIRQKRT